MGDTELLKGKGGRGGGNGNGNENENENGSGGGIIGGGRRRRRLGDSESASRAMLYVVVGLAVLSAAAAAAWPGYGAFAALVTGVISASVLVAQRADGLNSPGDGDALALRLSAAASALVMLGLCVSSARLWFRMGGWVGWLRIATAVAFLCFLGLAGIMAWRAAELKRPMGLAERRALLAEAVITLVAVFVGGVFVIYVSMAVYLQRHPETPRSVRPSLPPSPPRLQRPVRPRSMALGLLS